MSGGTRECRCTCDGFAMFLRLFSFLAYLCTAAAAGWGFVLANKRWQTENLTIGANSTLQGLADGLTSLNRSMALFQGLMAVYYVCVGDWGLGMVGAVGKPGPMRQGRNAPTISHPFSHRPPYAATPLHRVTQAVLLPGHVLRAAHAVPARHGAAAPQLPDHVLWPVLLPHLHR
jgi:hypothetical protein